ncbi:MAG: hypothetical protein QOD99_363 [Chthoniobacter sp.]|nr:hypothetical protein [Chthoniobacter sp.]
MNDKGAGGDSAARDRDLLRTVVDNLPDSIFAKDRDGRFILANATVARIIGVASPDDLIGHTDAELVDAQRAEHYRAVDEKVIRDGEALINLEEPSIGSDGKTHWDKTTKIPLRDSDGEICGLVAISRDITERKLADARLRAAHEDLRAAQLQIIDIEKFRSIGRLAAGVAHEVKNPLAIASMGLDFLSQEKFPVGSNAPAVIEEMRNAISRADLIVRGLLDFSEPKHLDLERHDLASIIDEAVGVMRGDLAGKNIVVKCDLQPDLPALPLDRDKITQVFISLFTNSVHAMKTAGELSIHARAEQLTGVGSNISDARSESFRVGDPVVIVEINDTGPGIPDEHLRKIFEPFFTTKPTGQGTGLGLAVVKTIVGLHGGTVEIRNRTEGGLNVTLIFKT